MRVVLVAGCLVVLAGLALGASLTPLARVTPVPVSAPGIGLPAAPVPALAQPAAAQAATAKQAAPSISILRSSTDVADPGPPAVVAPVLTTPAPVAPNDTAPRVDSVTTQCVVKPQVKVNRAERSVTWCPPLPVNSRAGSEDKDQHGGGD